MKKVRIVLWSAVVVAAAVSATLWMTERNQGPVAARVDPEAETFKIYYQKIEEASSPDGYTMGHTSSFLLFDRESEFVRTYEYDEEPRLIVTDLRERIGA